MRRLIFLLLPICTVLSAISCTQGPATWFGNNKTAILWSDQPGFALYGEYFNASQNQYKVEMHYYDFPAQKLQETMLSKEGSVYPDIVAGSWLKSASTRAFFKPLDKYLKGNALAKDAFYPRLLAMGNIDGKQYLLPVSFNAPVVIFARDNQDLLSNPFTIDFDELKTLGQSYNTETSGTYTRMGFSPTWDDNFLFIIATLLNASFRETEPLAWDSPALDSSMNFAYDWTCETNANIQSVDDFTFKYLYDPPAKLVLSGRILFTFMDSGSFFTLPEDQQNNLDFRWLAERNTIPLAEQSIYFGLAKKGKAPKAAEAFLHWFFNTGAQRELLERSRKNRIFESSFGIGGGFSAMRPVTEQVFPQFYHGLLGHMPPSESLSPANILPSNWMILKERVILPYLHDRARQSNHEGITSLERRLADWLRISR
jgi:ABC-type glycerol-3-phosphate transport system substrate-binding protein